MDIHLNSLQRVLQGQDAQGTGFLVQRFEDPQVAEVIRCFASLLGFFKEFDQFRVPEHGHVPPLVPSTFGLL